MTCKNSFRHNSLHLAIMSLCLLICGCRGVKLTSQEVTFIDNGSLVRADRETALNQGTRALSNFLRAYIKRDENYTKTTGVAARNSLNDALLKLRLSDGKSAPRGLVATVEALEIALGAMDRIIANNTIRNDLDNEQGWAEFDAAALALAESLQPKRTGTNND